MISRAKFTFWILFFLVFLFLSVPSVVLVQNLREYAEALSYWSRKPPQAPPEPGTRPAFLTSKTAPQTSLHFMKFSYAGKAKSVQLAGDFNLWKAEQYPLSRKGRKWEITLPLPQGTYRYLFYVDGEKVLDPKNKEVYQKDDFKASVKRVP